MWHGEVDRGAKQAFPNSNICVGIHALSAGISLSGTASSIAPYFKSRVNPSHIVAICCTTRTQRVMYYFVLVVDPAWR